MSNESSAAVREHEATSTQPVPTSLIAAVLAEHQTELAERTRMSGSALGQADLEAAVDTGVLTGVRSALDGDDVDSVRHHAETASTAVAEATAEVQQHAPASGSPPSDYSQLGGVIPVIPGSPGAGASVVAAVLADALQQLSWRVLLADTADVARSGLSFAARSEGSVRPGPHETVRIRFSWRGRALVARPETTLPMLSPGMVPPPSFWVPPVGHPQFTVVDLSYDAWRLAAQPLSGPGCWLRMGQPVPRPLLVVRPSRPSLAQAEQALARLETWTVPGVAVPPAALVVVGANRWPGGVAGAAGRRVGQLLDRTVFLPHLSEVATGGIGPDITPLRLREAIAPLLRAWRLAPSYSGRGKAARLFGKGGQS